MEVTVKPYTVQQVIYCWPIVLCSNQWVRPLKVKPSRRCKHPVLGHGAQPHSHADQPVAHDALDLSSECTQKSQENGAAPFRNFGKSWNFIWLRARVFQVGIKSRIAWNRSALPASPRHDGLSEGSWALLHHRMNCHLLWPTKKHCDCSGLAMHAVWRKRERQYCRHRQGIVLRTASEHASVACHGLQKM